MPDPCAKLGPDDHQLLRPRAASRATREGRFPSDPPHTLLRGLHCDMRNLPLTSAPTADTELPKSLGFPGSWEHLSEEEEEETLGPRGGERGWRWR